MSGYSVKIIKCSLGDSHDLVCFDHLVHVDFECQLVVNNDPQLSLFLVQWFGIVAHP